MHLEDKSIAGGGARRTFLLEDIHDITHQLADNVGAAVAYDSHVSVPEK